MACGCPTQADTPGQQCPHTNPCGGRQPFCCFTSTTTLVLSSFLVWIDTSPSTKEAWRRCLGCISTSSATRFKRPKPVQVYVRVSSTQSVLQVQVVDNFFSGTNVKTTNQPRNDGSSQGHCRGQVGMCAAEACKYEQMCAVLVGSQVTKTKERRFIGVRVLCDYYREPAKRSHACAPTA